MSGGIGAHWANHATTHTHTTLRNIPETLNLSTIYKPKISRPKGEFDISGGVEGGRVEWRGGGGWWWLMLKERGGGEGWWWRTGGCSSRIVHVTFCIVSYLFNTGIADAMCCSTQHPVPRHVLAVPELVVPVIALCSYFASLPASFVASLLAC